jgi:hypothetical protein
MWGRVKERGSLRIEISREEGEASKAGIVMRSFNEPACSAQSLDQN